MKKIASLFLIICIVVVFSLQVNAGSYHEGLREGERLADREHSAVLFWVIGFPAAVLFSPLLGGGLTLIVAYSSNPRPDSSRMSLLSREHSSDYVMGVEDGYRSAARSKNIRAAWGSTGTAFVINVLFILATYEARPEPVHIPVFSFNF